MKTSDGGASWDTSLVETTTEDLDGGIAFSTALNGIIFGDGAAGEIWSTTDGGSSWSVYNIVLPMLLTSKRMYSASCVPGTQNFAFVGYHNTTWKSTDGGASFSNVGDYSYSYARNTFVKMFDADNWVVFTNESDMLTTADAGVTWDTTSIGTGQSFQAAAFSSKTNGMVMASYGQWKTTTDGSTFVNVYEWPAISFWGLAFPEDGTVMLGAWGGGEIAKSTDGGSTFSYPDNYASETGENIYEMEFLDANTGLIAGGYAMLKKTVDGGDTWVTIDNPMMYESNRHINAMHVAADGTVFVGGSKGDIMKSVDDGDTWTPIENEATQTVYDIHVFDDGQIMASMGSGQFALYNAVTDTFELVADYGTMSLRSITEANGVVLIAASDDWIYRTTTDSLDTLTQVYNEPSSEPFYDVVFVDDLTAYAVADGGHIHKSVDAGLTWTEEVTGLGDYTLDKIGTNGDKIFVLGKAGVVMSLDILEVQADYTETFESGGEFLSWAENTINANSGGLNLIIFSDPSEGSIGRYTDDANTGLLYADIGKKLKNYEVSADIYIVKPQSATEPTYKGLVVKCDPEEQLFYRYVYKNSTSSNGALKLQGFDGASWYISKQWTPGEDFDTLSTGFHNFKAQVIDNKFWVYIDNMLLPGCPYSHEDPQVVTVGYPGIYKYNVGPATVEFDNFNVNVYEFEEETAILNNDVPSEFVLEQNYPNPFNPATTLKFQIPNADMVAISIYNVAGRKVAEVMNEQLEAGFYSVNFNASALPSGVYLYRLTAGEFSSVKKMTLLK
jgi:photosystem II stability/assembly factor-like uncharacterized protein